MIQESHNQIIQYTQVLVEASRQPFLILDANSRVVAASEAFFKKFKITKEQTENYLFSEVGNQQWDILELKKLIKEILPLKKPIINFEVKYIYEDLSESVIWLNARMINIFGMGEMIIINIEDSTKIKTAQNIILDYTNRLLLRADDNEKQIKIIQERFNKQLIDLQILNKYMVDREIKMLELKKEVAKLLKLLNIQNVL